MSPGPDHKSYYHELFLRGRPELALAMKRLHQPGKRNPDPSGEPNFYRIAEHYPLPPDPILVPDHNDVVAASNHEEPIFIHENADAFHSEKKSAQYVTSPVDSPRKRSLQPKQRLCEISGSHRQETPSASYAQAPTLHHYLSDQDRTKRQCHERHSYPPNAYCNPPGHQHEHFHRYYPPHPYPSNNGPYGYANYSHFQNPYTSPERHYHQHRHFLITQHQGYPSQEASHGNGGHYGYYNQHQWHQEYHNSYGNYGTPEKGRTIAAGQYNPTMPGNYHKQDVWNYRSCDQFQPLTNTEAIHYTGAATSAASACYGVQNYESSFQEIGSAKKSLEEQHSESKPTKYIISAQGLQPVNNDNATVALDERKLPAISNRFTTESSPFIDNSNSKERTNSLSEMYELLTDNGSNKFSADGVKQVEDNDVKEVQFDERKLSAAGSDTIGSTSCRDN